MNWPNDADGNVFRRLQEQNFDFEKPYAIDFQVDFDRWPPTRQALERLRNRYPSATAHEPDAESRGYVQFQVRDRLTYELVTRIQADITDLMAPFGGKCNSWGVLH
jgi:hypothetical protein